MISEITDGTGLRPGPDRPREHLAVVGRTYPDLWRKVDRARAMRGRELPDWPDWCFLPLQGVYAILSGGGNRRIAFDRIHHLGIIGALAAWRVTQGIYRFDSTLAQAVTETPLDGELPAALLYHLPEWCVYVETPGQSWLGRPLHGFWAHLDFDIEGGADELRLLLDVAEAPDLALDRERGLLPLPLILGDGTLADAFERATESGRRQAQAAGIASPTREGDAETAAESLVPLVALLLYLCAENAEIGDGSRRPATPQPKRTKRGPRLFPPNTATTWDVGVRLGAALRQSVRDDGGTPDAGTGRQRASPRPHIRRAHWHTYLTGKGRQTRKVRWVAPVAVRVEGPGALPATVRPVE